VKRPVATLDDASFLDVNPLTDLIAPGAADVIVWSGTLSDEGRFARDVRTWMPPGVQAFDAMLERLTTELRERNQRLLFRPHARHVLCDPQRCLTFLRDKVDAQGLPFGLALDAAAMLEANMLEKAEDHAARAFEALGEHAAVVIVANAEPPADPDDPDALPTITPAHRGVLPAWFLRDMIERHVPEPAPLILLPDDADEQKTALGLA